MADPGYTTGGYNEAETSEESLLLSCLKRTEANVVDSDATLVFTYGKATGGSKKTIQFADLRCWI